jgi:hypothetical protein
VSFSVDGTPVNWSNTSTTSLAPGTATTLTANGGPSGTGFFRSLISNVAAGTSRTLALSPVFLSELMRTKKASTISSQKLKADVP